MVPNCRADFASIGSEKNIQAWAPFPDFDISMATSTPNRVAASLYARISSSHVVLSKSAARNMQVSSVRIAYVPMKILPSR